MPHRVAATMTGIRYAIGTRLAATSCLSNSRTGGDQADACQRHQQRQDIRPPDTTRRQVFIQPRSASLPTFDRPHARFRELLNHGQINQGVCFRKERHRVIVGWLARAAARSRPDHFDLRRGNPDTQDQHSPAERAVPRLNQSLPRCRQLTQRSQHSPYRRRKSMSVNVMRNIKVIVFWPRKHLRGRLSCRLSGRLVAIYRSNLRRLTNQVAATCDISVLQSTAEY